MNATTQTFTARDEFNRKGIAENIISLFEGDIDISPLVIDGSWGTGKTEFCHKLIDLMRTSDNHHLIYIDAFKADHADEPLMTVLAEVVKLLPDNKKKADFKKKALPALRFVLNAAAKAGVAHILRQDVADVVNDFDDAIQDTADTAIDATVASVLKDHVEAEQNLIMLQTALEEIASEKPIIFFMDELDRCRPSFAIDMLEIIKHIFNVEGVSFVLITNTQQLKASINHCYGQNVDAQRYLDKFVKFSLTLPETVNKGGYKDSIAALDHYKHLVRKSTLLKEWRLSQDNSIYVLERLIKENNVSLREVETIVRYFEIYFKLSNDNYLTANTVYIYKVITILAIAIYCISPEVAKSILNKRFDANEFGKLMGVEKLSSWDSLRIKDIELICYIFNSQAFRNKESYVPPDNELKEWDDAKNRVFSDEFRDPIDIFSIWAKAIQTIGCVKL